MIGGGGRPYSSCPSGGKLAINPLGDSQTAGLVVNGGFRSPLLGMVADARGGAVGPGGVVDSLGDLDCALYGYAPNCGTSHSGHNGSSAQQWIDNGWMSQFNPGAGVHFATLLLGANDPGDRVITAQNILQLAAQWFALHPFGNLFLSNRLPRSFAGTAVVNAYLEAGVAAMRAAGQNVVLVDLHSVVTLADLYDGLHPTESANQRIAAKWFAAMRPFLRP